MFSLCVGATAVCMLSSLGFLNPLGLESEAYEASAFNREIRPGGESIQSTAVSPTHAVIPLGSVFGIKLFTDGVIVASLSDIYTEEGLCCPAAEAGLKPGDYLLKANGMEIQDNASLAGFIGKSRGEPILFQVKRDDRVFETQVIPVYGDGSFKTGMWVRDSAAGIGTLTFYDPETKRFAGLGHGICDTDTNGVMSLKEGQPAPITLCGIVKGTPDSPGQLKGYFSSSDAMGQLLTNNDTGVYGTLSQAPQGQRVEVLEKKQVKKGNAQILCTVDDSGPKLYSVQIQRVSGTSQRTKNLVVHVTDPKLLSITGGIVQGMSGCPIFQGGKLAGAVTHVFTEDPTTGYGIFAETMLQESSISCSQY